MLAIDATHAARAREIFDAALCQPIVTPLTDDELVELDAQFNGRDCGVKHSIAPHKQSAYSHLPMRGICYGNASQAQEKQRAIALWPELRVQRRAPIESQSKPHPDSAYARLPLRGMGFDGSTPKHKWTLTATEKRELAARPLKYVQVNH